MHIWFICNLSFGFFPPLKATFFFVRKKKKKKNPRNPVEHQKEMQKVSFLCSSGSNPLLQIALPSSHGLATPFLSRPSSSISVSSSCLPFSRLRIHRLPLSPLQGTGNFYFLIIFRASFLYGFVFSRLFCVSECVVLAWCGVIELKKMDKISRL